jgi:hypothetical protein
MLGKVLGAGAIAGTNEAIERTANYLKVKSLTKGREKEEKSKKFVDYVLRK